MRRLWVGWVTHRRDRSSVPRECGEWHDGICWAERFSAWSSTGYVPPEYRDGSWYRLTPDGRVPLKCR